MLYRFTYGDFHPRDEAYPFVDGEKKTLCITDGRSNRRVENKLFCFCETDVIIILFEIYFYFYRT